MKLSFHRYNNKRVAADPKTDVATGEGHTVDAVVVVVIAWTGVLGENAAKGFSLLSGESSSHLHRHLHLQRLPLLFIDEAAAGLGMAVGISDVWLDVEDGCAVHQVGPQHMQHRAEMVVHFNAV